MKRRTITIIYLIVLSLGLTGCIIPTIPEMTEEQEEYITEYAAGLLLKYNASETNGLMSKQQLEKAALQEELQKEREEETRRLAKEYVEKTQEATRLKEEAKASKDAQSNSDKGAQKDDVAVDASDMGAFLGLDDVEVSFAGFDSMKTYPQDGSNSAFAVDAPSGRKLVVAHISMKNNSSEDIYVDMFDKEFRYQLDLGDGSRVDNSKTLLLNDFSMYKDNVSAGGLVEAVLLFEVDDDVDTDAARLAFKNGSQVGNLVVKVD